MGRSTNFWNRIAKRYAKKPIADEAAYEKKLYVTRKYLQPDMHVLEIGCGTGSTAIIHAPYVKHIYAIDFSEKMIEIAQEKADATNIKNITFVQTSVEKLDIKDKSIDVVLGLSILHLLEDKEAVIDQVYNLLKPNGIFVTSTICIGESMRYFKYIAPLGHLLGLMPLVKVFTVSELEKSLSDVGFILDYQWQPAKNKAVFIVAKKSK